MRALSIDDNSLNLRVIAAMLQTRGIETDSCQEVDDGYALLDRQDYNWLLVDLHMPATSGIDVIQAVRARGDASSRVPICVVTADLVGNVRAEVMAAGANSLITKPVMMDRLLAFIDAYPPEPHERESAPPAPGDA